MEQQNPKVIFEKLYNKPLTEKEMFEIEQNLLGFFQLLKTIDDKNKEQGNERNIRSPNRASQTK